MSRHALADIVDLDAYPLDQPDSDGLVDIVKRCRAALDARGCSVLESFFAPGIETMRQEAAELAPQAYMQERYGNPYSSPDNPNLPEDHPVRTFLKRTQGFVAGDTIAESTALKRVYRDASFRNFVAQCLELEEIHEYADPLGCLVINVVRDQAQHPWHFDANEFIVSTLVQAPQAGGLFEYCPDIRSLEDENFERVSRVIRDVDRGEVHTLNLRPGDIQLFKGRFSLHRVTPVEGPRPRLSAIFAYATSPDMMATADRTRHLFGRASARHDEWAESTGPVARPID